MAKTGDVIANPSTGEEFTIRRSAAETNGEVLDAVITIKAGAPGPPGHIHPVVEERLKMVGGTLEVEIDGERRTLKAGDEFVVEPGMAHKLWNEGEEDASFEAEIRPALRMETFIETIFGLARDGKVNKAGRPNMLQAAVLLNEYSEEFRLAGVPAIAQTVLFGALAPVGKLFGYKARYPQYSGEDGGTAD